MFWQEAHAYCPVCRRPRRVTRRAVNHLLHFVLSLLTAGFWLVLWFLAVYASAPWVCSSCGSTVESDAVDRSFLASWPTGRAPH